MHRPRSLAVAALLIGLAVVASACSALLPPEAIPTSAGASAVMLSDALVYGEWLVTIVGAVAAVVLLGRRPQCAAGLLAASLYTLTVGIAFAVYGVSAFGGSDAGMGPAFFGGPLVLLGGLVAIASGVIALSHRQGRRLGRALLAAGVGAGLTVGWLLLRGPGDWQGAVGVTRLHGAPIALAVVAVSVTISLRVRSSSESGSRAASDDAPFDDLSC